MTRKRILIVDDDVIVTRNVKLCLEKTDAFIVRAENSARAAHAAARDFKPDAILLDIMMPEMDGGEVAAQIRADPLLKNTPIIYLTAIVTKNEAHGETPVGLQGRYLAKPVDLEELVSCIEGALN